MQALSHQIHMQQQKQDMIPSPNKVLSGPGSGVIDIDQFIQTKQKRLSPKLFKNGASKSPPTTSMDFQTKTSSMEEDQKHGQEVAKQVHVSHSQTSMQQRKNLYKVKAAAHT